MEKEFSTYKGKITHGQKKWNIHGICGRTIEIRENKDNTLVVKWGDPRVKPILEKNDAKCLPNQLANLNHMNKQLETHLPRSDSRFRPDIIAREKNDKAFPSDENIAQMHNKMWFVKDSKTHTWISILDKDSQIVQYWAEKEKRINMLMSEVG